MKPSALFACLLLCAGCGTDSPTAPSAPPPANGSRAGTWVGTWTDAVNGTGMLRLDLEERTGNSGNLLSGTWAMTFPDPERNARGSIAGLVTGTQMSALGSTEPTPVCPPVPFAAPGLLTIRGTFGTSELTGTYNYGLCTESSAGTMALRRQ